MEEEKEEERGRAREAETDCNVETSLLPLGPKWEGEEWTEGRRSVRGRLGKKGETKRGK